MAKPANCVGHGLRFPVNQMIMSMSCLGPPGEAESELKEARLQLDQNRFCFKRFSLGFRKRKRPWPH